MRKLVVGLTVALAAAGIAALTVSAATAGAKPRKCGGLYEPSCKGPKCGKNHRYEPPCKNPKVKGVILSRRTRITCTQAGNNIRLAKVTVVGVAGLVRVLVKLDGRTIATYAHLGGVRHIRVGGFVIPTHGLKSGRHTVTVIATDRTHRHTVQTSHFSICRVSVGFTG